MVERCDSVSASKCKQHIREVAVEIFCWMEDRPVGSNPEIQSKQAKVKGTTVPDEGNDADNRYGEHQDIE